MTLPALRDDALRRTADGFELHLSLPWIRSLPVASLRELTVTVDGEPVDDLRARLGGDLIDVGGLAGRSEWWYIQDRLPLVAARQLDAGAHEVAVTFGLAVPYLAAGPDGPLTLPFRHTATLDPDAGDAAHLPRGWMLSASAFNWTPEVIAAERPATEIAVEVARDVEPVIELEAGQVWRTFPVPDDAEVDALRDRLEAVGGQVSIVGASIDAWTPDGRRRDDAERLAFLLPQLRAASRLGAQGVRLPIGQAGRNLLERLQPVLRDLDIVWFEEAQGHQTPTAEAAAFDDIAELDDPHVRVLIDISMLMPALPVTYLDRLRAAGADPDFVHRLETDWRDPATHGAVIDMLRSGAVPGPVHTLFMNLLVRFGRSDAADLRGILPLMSGVHLKFWDLDDADGRVTNPIRDLGRELRTYGFAGTLCSEWGGHEWLDDDPAEMTSAHLRLARRALAN